MRRFSLRLDEVVYAEAQQWAQRDGVSLNDWLAAAIDRETIRRRLDAHNTWAKDNPIYSAERWEAEQGDIADAVREEWRGDQAA